MNKPLKIPVWGNAVFLSAILAWLLLAPPVPAEERAFLEILAPNGGETLQKGAPCRIRWRGAPMTGTISLILFKNSVKYMTISDAAPNSSQFEWRVPASVPAGAAYRIRIRDKNQPEVGDFSDNDFTISD